MLRSIVVGLVILGSVVVPAPGVFADEPLYQCVVRAAEGGSWTDGAFDGYALGYAVHSGDAWMSLTCAIAVNGSVMTSVSGQATGGHVVAQGRVRFVARPFDRVDVIATLTSSHGTRTTSVPYFPYDEQPVQLPTGQMSDCGLDVVKTGSAAGDPSEGVARGYVTRVRGGDVTIRCFVRVDGYEQQFGSTPTGNGTGAAATSGLVMFHAEPWSSIEIVAEVTTPDGTFSTARPYMSSLHDLGGVDALGFDSGCSLLATRDGQYYEGDVYGYVTDSNAYVSIRCYITVNGWYAETTPTSSGRDVATTQGSVRFEAGSGDDVELCTEAWTSDGSFDIRCKDTTLTHVPPQEAFEFVEPVEQIVWAFKPLSDPLLCPFLPTLRGSWGPVTIDYWDGDVLVDGWRVYDCWPYEPWDDDHPVGVEAITG